MKEKSGPDMQIYLFGKNVPQRGGPLFNDKYILLISIIMIRSRSRHIKRNNIQFYSNKRSLAINNKKYSNKLL